MRSSRLVAALVLGVAALSPSASVAQEASPRLTLAATYETGHERGAEIVAVHAATARLVVVNSEHGEIDVVDLSDPEAPRRIARHTVPRKPAEHLTSAAIHPSGTYVVAVVQNEAPDVSGRLVLLRMADGQRLGAHAIGVGPDDVAIAPDGRTAVVANEAEGYAWDPATATYTSAEGTIAVVDLSRGPACTTVKLLSLPDLTGHPGVTQAKDRRFLERNVDRDGNGKIEGDEKDVMIPLDATPPHLEPEYVTYAPDSRQAYVTLQENNAVAVVDPIAGRLVRVLGLGITDHPADRKDDGTIDFSDRLLAFREPDGISVTPDGRYLVTADEGDTDPRASKTPVGLAAGGGRTLSVFDARTGALVGDTGGQLDAAAAAAGVYPDHRSAGRGSEPEVPVAFSVDGTTFVALSLEWANAVALVSLETPAKPRVLGAYPLGEGGISPEGVAVYQADGNTWVISANEMSGDVTIYAFRTEPCEND